MKQHSPQFLNLVAEAKQRIQEISAVALKAKLDGHEPLYLIDIREDSEWQGSEHLPGAIHLGKGIIERDIEKLIPDFNAQIIVYCSGGFRCALTANTLQQMGYQQVYSLKDGIQGWLNAGYRLDPNIV